MNSFATAALAAALVTFALLEGLRRADRVPADLSRKLWFATTALLALPCVLWVDSRSTVVTIYLALSLAGYLSFRFEIFESIEDDGASLGSVLLPLACTVLLYRYWGERSYLAVAGIFAAGFGDSVAALVGRRTGTRKYRSFASTRSMEGTLSMFFVTGITVAPVLAVLGELGWHQAVAFALIGATVAACVEAVSVFAIDNFAVPVVTTATLGALVRFSH